MHDIGVAIAATLVGAIVSVVALVWVLGELSRAEERLRAAPGSVRTWPPLIEVVVVATAAVAVSFAVWFFFLAAPGPRAVPHI